jgi:hypothetical protein
MQGSTGYMNVVAILIESYAMESIWLLVLTIIGNRVVTVAIFFQETVHYIEVNFP